MNNIFNINRFWNLIQMDAKRFITNYGLSILIICLSPTITWIFSLLTGLEVSIVFRYVFNALVLYIAMMMTPNKVYGEVNLKREGVAYAMLPASTLEKFLSMFIFCTIVTPVVVYLGTYSIDSLLALIPWGGFNGYLQFNAFNHAIDTFKNVGGEEIDQIRQIIKPFTLRLYYYLGIVSWIAIFMLGNLVFQKRKNAKTILCYFGFQYVVSMIMNVAILNNTNFFSEMFSDLSTELAFHYAHNFVTVSLIITIIITLALLFFSYRKIKTQKY